MRALKITETGLAERTELFFKCCLTSFNNIAKSVGCDVVLVPT